MYMKFVYLLMRVFLKLSIMYRMLPSKDQQYGKNSEHQEIIPCTVADSVLSFFYFFIHLSFWDIAPHQTWCSLTGEGDESNSKLKGSSCFP